MTSIRKRMAVMLSGAVAALLIVGGVVIYLTIRAVLVAQFDETLNAKAQALIVASELDGRRLEIDFDVEEFAGFGPSERRDYFEVWNRDGRSVEKSPSLDDGELPWRESGTADIMLPGGSSGRAVWVAFRAESRREGKEMVLCVASHSDGLEKSLSSIAMILAVVAGVGSLVAVVIVFACLNRGLHPIVALGEEVRRVDVSRLDQRIEEEGLPAELRVIAAKLNDMLERLEEGFARERRFSSHAAHELRTPLAELKTMVEFVTKWPEEFRKGLGEEMLGAIAEGEALLSKLSLLSSVETDKVSRQGTAIDVREAIASCLGKVEDTVVKRRLSVLTEIEDGRIVTEPVLWNAIANNLLGNAVSHAPEGAEVFVRVSSKSLIVENRAPDLDAGDVGHLFERFWRKSEARSGRQHSGLGLSIARACAEALGGGCRAGLRDGRLIVEAWWTEGDVAV